MVFGLVILFYGDHFKDNFRPLGEEFRRRGTRDRRRRVRGPGVLTQCDTRDQGTPIIIVTRSNFLWK